MLRSGIGRVRVLVAFVAVALSTGVSLAQQDTAESKGVEIDAAIAKVYPALVRVHVVATRPSAGRMEKFGGTGSGTIIHPDGYVVTNHHVAGNGTRIWCRLADKTRVDATLVGTDPQTDLCIIKLDLDQIPDELKPLPVAEFGRVDAIEVGDTVLAMGSPAGVSQSVTIGVVANTEMITPENTRSTRQEGERVGDLVRWIGHDAVIYFGNSGGPLVNLAGEIIGVNEVGLGSLGGAIPADIAKDVVNQLIENKTVERSWTGIYAQPALKSSSKSLEGILVSGVYENSPATEAGIKAGDVITSFDGVSIDAKAPEHLPLFNRVVLGTPVGKEVEVTVSRKGEAKTLKLKTVMRSKARGADVELKSWGVTARELTRRSAISMDRDSSDGIVVSSVSPAGPAAAAKPSIKTGDIILSVAGQTTNNLEELMKASSEASSGESITALVEFERSDRLYATVVEIGKELNASKSSAAKKAWLGLSTQVLTRKLATALDLKGKKGVRVTYVLPGTEAEKAGFQKGDVLLKIDGEVIRAEREKDSNVFRTMIRDYPVDEVVEFDLVRDGESTKLKCLLESAPVATAEFALYEDESLEFTVRELSSASTTEIEARKGLYVEKVERAGWAALAGLSRGDIIQEVNDTAVESLEQIESTMNEISDRKDEYIVLFVVRGGKTRFIEVHPVWPSQE